MASAAEAHGLTEVASLLNGPFERWYDQDGTPHVDVAVSWVPEEGGTLVLDFQQSCAPSRSDPTKAKAPYVVPIRLGLFDESSGTELQVALQRASTDVGTTLLLHGNVAVISRDNEQLRLKNVPATAMPSLLREFSAPITMNVDVSGKLQDGDASPSATVQARLRDPDPLSRFDVVEGVALSTLRGIYDGQGTNAGDGDYFGIFEEILEDETLDLSLRTQLLTLPAFSTFVSQNLKLNVCPRTACDAYTTLKTALAEQFRPRLLQLYDTHSALDGSTLRIPYSFEPTQVSRRRFANFCLRSLAHLPLTDATGRAEVRVVAVCRFLCVCISFPCPVR